VGHAGGGLHLKQLPKELQASVGSDGAAQAGRGGAEMLINSPNLEM
jgi:hypothetical protein